MKMQLLGTAGGDFPRVDNLEDKFAYLPQVRALGGRNLRYAAQAVIFPDILIDFYSTRQMATYGVAADSIKHLFITHAHWDHFQPLEILKLAAELPHQLQVYGNQSVIDALTFVNAYDYDRNRGRFVTRSSQVDFGCHVMKPEDTLSVGNTTVGVVHSNHDIDKSDNMIMVETCLNYVFERDGKTVFYGLDSSYMIPRSVEFLRRFRVDVAVLDASYGQWPIDVARSGHHNLAMLAETIDELRKVGAFHDGTTILASHLAMAEVKPYDELVDETTRMGATLAYDGMIVDV